MALTEKELEYFRTQLPEGYAVVDLSDIQSTEDFVKKYCHFKYSDLAYLAKMTLALDEFIKQANESNRNKY